MGTIGCLGEEKVEVKGALRQAQGDKGEGKGLAEAINFFVNMGQAELEEWSVAAALYARQATDIEKIRREYRVLFGV